MRSSKPSTARAWSSRLPKRRQSSLARRRPLTPSEPSTARRAANRTRTGTVHPTMSSPADLKSRACRAIDAHATDLESLARQIFDQPELGFKEHRTASLVHDWFDRLNLPHRDGIALTGTRADIHGG